MARLPQAFLADIKTTPIAQVLEAGGHQLRPAGQGRLSCRCPFPDHEDKTPSFFVDDAKNLWKCFGACNAGGDVIELVKRLEGLRFVDAVAWLARFTGKDFQASTYKSAGSLSAGGVPDECPLEPDCSTAEIGRRVVDWYHARLLDRGSRGWEYLKSRGLDDDRLASRFRLGFAPSGPSGLLRVVPDCQRKAGKAIRADLVKAGWSREYPTKRGGKEFTTSRESLGNCVTVPILGTDGAILECYGRKALFRRDGSPVHFYLPGSHAGVWNADGCMSADGVVILCEAALDAMTLWVHGFENVTWAYGCGGFTADHLQHLQNIFAKTIVIAYDNDDAGNKAAEKLSETLQKHGFAVQRALPPVGKDVNQMALDAGNQAKGAMQALIREAAWWGGSAAPVVSVKEPEKEKELEEIQEVAEVEKRPAAKPVQASPSGPADSVRDGEDLWIDATTRRYRLRGLFANKTDMALKANVRAEKGDVIYADSFDLYQAKARTHFIRCCAAELGLHDDVIRSDMARILRAAEAALDDHRVAVAAQRESAAVAAAPEMSDDERAEALALLQDPDLLQRIADDLAACGLVGEPVNKLTCYLAATSRLMDDPLGVIIQSSSAAGKSSLMDAVLRLMPDEAVTQYSAMTEQSLFYQGESALKHRILAIAEEAGAGKIAYSLKILISDHYLTIAAPRQNPDTGCFETIDYRVDGPTAVLMTTTADDDDLDPELLNRCLVMSVDESADQTAAILGRQRDKFSLGGMLSADAVAAIRRKHHNAQRLLRPLRVVIPQASRLTFATHLPRLRRDHMKYLNMICCVALLHQEQRKIHQHPTGFEYIEATVSDIAAANDIIAAVLGRSIAGMLPHTRELLELADRYVTEQAQNLGIARDAVRFTRRQLREWCAWGDTRLRKHLARLVEWEIVSSSRSEGGGFHYALHYEPADRDRFRVHLHLIDPAKLAETYNGSTASAPLAGASAPHVHPISTPDAPHVHPRENVQDPGNNGANGSSVDFPAENGPCGGGSEKRSQPNPSYPQQRPRPQDGAA